MNHSEYASPPIEISASTRRRLIESLDNWNFEPHKLPEEEVLCCTQILFETLFRVTGMQDAIGLSLGKSHTLVRSDPQLLTLSQVKYPNSFDTYAQSTASKTPITIFSMPLTFSKPLKHFSAQRAKSLPWRY